MLADLKPELLVLCPRPSTCAGTFERFTVRETPLASAGLFLTAPGGNMGADGGRFAEREGEVVVEDVPVFPFIAVWIFSGRFNLLILAQFGEFVCTREQQQLVQSKALYLSSHVN